MRLAGKVALVTGGADGIGAAIATLFAREGAKVAIADIQREKGSALARNISAAGGTAHYEFLNVTDPDNWSTVIARILEKFGSITTLVNNAGMYHPGGIESEIAEGWNKIIAVNQTSVFFGMKAAIPALLASGNASIINISSLFGLVGSPNAISYHASKAAVRHMTKATALEFAARGVRVNAILPGQIKTTMLSQITPEQAAAIQAATPIGRIGEPDDIAYGALYLCSDEAKFVTGVDLVIDGGWAAG